jgi:ubiquinone/menaquinone biosynthesis C-methylase UbiE
MSEQTAAQHEDALIGIDRARAYAREAQSPFMRLGYSRVVKGIVQRGLQGRFLEIGSGPAVLTTMIARAIPEARITAVDISPAMVTIAKEQVESEGLTDRIEFVEGDATDAGLLDQLGQFDLVYSTFSLHHWDDPEGAIKNLLRSVSSGGTLLIHDLRRVWWLSRIPSDDGFIRSIRAAYTPAELGDLLAKIGVERYEIKSGPFYQSAIVRA